MRKLITGLVVFGCVGVAGAWTDFRGNTYVKEAIFESSFTQTGEQAVCLSTMTDETFYLDHVNISSGGVASFFEMWDSSFTSTEVKIATSTSGKLLLRLDTRTAGTFPYHINTSKALWYNNSGTTPAKVNLFFNRGR